MLLITLDTNLVDPVDVAQLSAALSNIPHSFASTSVTDREHGFDVVSSSVEGDASLHRAVSWDASLHRAVSWDGPIPAVFVIGESLLAGGDESDSGRFDVLADEHNLLEPILAIISDGSFPRPGRRESLSLGEQRQLRDAMIYEAHVRSRRHLFVTNDRRAFVRHGKREVLERLGSTKIFTSGEILAMSQAGTLQGFVALP